MVKTFLTSGLSCLLLAIASNEAEAAAAAPPNQPVLSPNPPSLLGGEFHSGGSGADRNFLYVEGEVRQEYGGGLRGGFHSGGGAVRNDYAGVEFHSGGVRNDYVAGGAFQSGGVQENYGGCPTVYDPICCEGRQYSNPCFAEIAGYGPSTNLCVVGECRVVVPVQPARPVNPVYVEPVRPVQPVYVEPVRPVQPVYVEPVRPVHPVEPVFVGCDQVYEPVCCDGYDFPNFCEAQQVNPGHSANNCLIGECRPVEIIPVRPVNPVVPVNPESHAGPDFSCDTVFEPVCCDGNTFSNFCEAEQVYGYSPNTCAIGECRPVKNKPVGIPAGPAAVICDSVYDPVCCDGNQFPNLCEAERVNPEDGGRSCIIGECQVY